MTTLSECTVDSSSVDGCARIHFGDCCMYTVKGDIGNAVARCQNIVKPRLLSP